MPQQGCINSTPATIIAGTDWDFIHVGSAEVSLDVPLSTLDFNSGLELDFIQSYTVESDLHLVVQQSATRVDVPLSGAEANTALFVDPAGASLEMLPSSLEFNTGLELDDEQSCAADSDHHLDVQQSAARVDTPFSRADVNKALFGSRLPGLGDTERKFPWESGVMGDIFLKSNDVASLPTCQQGIWTLQIRCTRLQMKMMLHRPHRGFRAGLLNCLFIHLRSRSDQAKPLLAAQEVLLTKAIDKWIQCFEVLGFPGQIGEALDSDLHFPEAAEQGIVLRDALGVKPPRTLVKRAHTLLQFFRWLHDNGSTWEPWSRANCLAYLISTDDRKPAASLGVSILEAIGLSRHVLQVHITDVLLQVPQLEGRAQISMLTKDVYHPVRPLKVREVATSEWMMLGHMYTVYKYMRGAVLFSIFLDHDGWICNISTALGLTGRDSHRSDLLGLRHLRCFKGVWMLPLFGPNCRALNLDGSLDMRSGASDVMSCFIYKVLRVADADKRSSHSFKPTTLIWARAYGIGEPACLLLLVWGI